MIKIDPRDSSGKLPADWRTPWAAFATLKRLGREIGEPVHLWELHGPSGLTKVVKRQWILKYTFKNGTIPRDVFLGTNGRDAEKALKDLIKGFEAVAEGERAYRASTARPKQVTTKQNPIYDAGLVIKYRDKWNTEIVKIRDRESSKQFHENNPNLIKFMRQRAGYLPMSMQDYLFKHPHGQRWPTPPANEQQFRNRQYQLEKETAEKERRRNYDGS